MLCDVLYSESSIEHESTSKGSCNFAYMAAFAFILVLKPIKITQFIHKSHFVEIILLKDLYFYDCEAELFSKNQVYRIMFRAEHPNQYAIKYGVDTSNSRLLFTRVGKCFAPITAPMT